MRMPFVFEGMFSASMASISLTTCLVYFAKNSCWINKKAFLKFDFMAWHWKQHVVALLTFLFSQTQWVESEPQHWVLRFLPSEAVLHSVAAVAGSAYLKESTHLMPDACRLLKSLAVRLLLTGVPKNKRLLQKHSISPVTVFKYFRMGTWWWTSTLTCVAPQSECIRRSEKWADVEVGGQQEWHGYCTHCQRQQQLKQIPETSPEPQKQHQQHTADAQAMKTWGRETK